MTLIAKQVREWHDVDIKTFREEIATAYEPTVLRSIAIDRQPSHEAEHMPALRSDANSTTAEGKCDILFLHSRLPCRSRWVRTQPP